MSRSIPRRLLAVLVIAGAMIGCGQRDEGDAVEFQVPVGVAEVGVGEVEDTIVATGSLRAEEVVTLSVETAGVLEIARSSGGRRLSEGDRVVAGQTVAEITGEDVRLAARTAATLQRYRSAESDLEASLELHEKGLINETEVRNAQTAVEEARIEYERSLHTETRNHLVTPIDGVILQLARDAEGQPLASGQLVVPGQVIARVAPTSILVAEVDLVGPDLARVVVGMPARVRHHAWSDRRFDGQVIRLAPTIDPLTRALRAELEVDNSEGLLRPGMFVEVTMVVEQRADVPVVPRQAVAERGGQKVVFVLAGQRVTRRDVTLGLGDDEVVEIRSGLEPGERVVVRGLETLTDQARVRVTGSS